MILRKENEEFLKLNNNRSFLSKQQSDYNSRGPMDHDDIEDRRDSNQNQTRENFNKAANDSGLYHSSNLNLTQNKSKLYDKTCSICTDDFSPNEKITITPCKHSFHDHCI